MFLSLLTSAIGMLNAASFLLMAAGPPLLEFIVISSIFSVGSWLYTWIMPAAVEYRPDRLPALRTMQVLVAGATIGLILTTHPTRMGLFFSVMIVVEAIAFPQHILLFQSNTKLYVRQELVRGMANTLALGATLLLFEKNAASYSFLAMTNVVVANLLLHLSGAHRIPSLRMAPLPSLLPQLSSMFRSPRLLQLLGARGLETGTLIGLSQFQALSPVLSMKIGMAISSALAVNARSRGLPILLGVHLSVYVGGIAAAILASRLPLGDIPVPETLKLLDPVNSIVVLPVVLAAFILTVRGLRTGFVSDGMSDGDHPD